MSSCIKLLTHTNTHKPPQTFLQAALLTGCLLNGAVLWTVAFSWTGGSNYLENGGQSLGSFALIEFRYLARAGPGLAQREAS